MAFDLKKEEDVKLYLENLKIEYTFGCYSEKKPEVCHLLGEYNEAVKKDFKKAGQIFKNNCDDYGYDRSCHSFAAYSLTGRGLAKENIPEAYQYFRKSCDLGYAAGCCSAGILAASETKGCAELTNYKKGVADLEKACSMGNANACFYLAGLYIGGSKDQTSVQKDMAKAVKYSEMACDLKNIYACANVSIMYKKGEGVEKNEKVSEDFKKRALDLQQEQNDQLLLNFQRGPET